MQPLWKRVVDLFSQRVHVPEDVQIALPRAIALTRRFQSENTIDRLSKELKRSYPQLTDNQISLAIELASHLS